MRRVVPVPDMPGHLDREGAKIGRRRKDLQPGIMGKAPADQPRQRRAIVGNRDHLGDREEVGHRDRDLALQFVGSEGKAQADRLRDAERDHVAGAKQRRAPQQQRIDGQPERGVRRAREQEAERAAVAHASSHNGIRIFSRSISRGRNGERSSSAGDVIRPSGCRFAPSLGARPTCSSIISSHSTGPSVASARRSRLEGRCATPHENRRNRMPPRPYQNRGR